MSELRELGDDEYVTKAEAVSMGMSTNHLAKHCTLSPRKARCTPSPVLGHLIAARHFYRSSRAGQRVRDVEVRVGDVREFLRLTRELWLPEGAILLRDAMPRLKAMGFGTSVSTVINLIKVGTIRGGKIDGFASKHFNPCKRFDRRDGKGRLDLRLWWMHWRDHEKIHRLERPGNRRCWIDGEDWYPMHEASRLTGLRSHEQLRTWVSRELGGRGIACPHLGRLVRCRMGPIPHRQSDQMKVCAGNDLRDIAETLTGVRPEMPIPPPRVKSAAAPSTATGGASAEPSSRTIHARKNW